MKKTILITGASLGFGRLNAKRFHQEEWNVIATMLDPSEETELNQLNNVLVTRLDVTDKDTIEKSVQEGIARFGKIDVLLNNAGIAKQGPFEYVSDGQLRALMEVNFFGMINVTKALLPHFRKNESGIIINVSSITGRMGFPFASGYGSTKFAIEGLTESLQFELNPFGIKLKLIEPGAFNTNMATNPNLWVALEESKEYKAKMELSIAAANNMVKGDPEEVVDMVYLAATDGTDKLRYPVGNDAIQMLEAKKQMDDTAFKEMVVQAMKL